MELCIYSTLNLERKEHVFFLGFQLNFLDSVILRLLVGVYLFEYFYVNFLFLRVG